MILVYDTMVYDSWCLADVLRYGVRSFGFGFQDEGVGCRAHRPIENPNISALSVIDALYGVYGMERDRVGCRL